ncbi:MAG TPA: OFA family MFS transporter [Nocardioides sp.]|uniref:L-lactate MFS transporter n=1 Tax=Nocardioides sp. TaxID=35761 RepID=UPI002ED9CBFC
MTHTDNQTAGSATGGVNRWLLVAGGLLLQFSIGAVYAWSVFAKAYQDAEPWQLSKVEASLPFTVTIGMIFVGSYVGGRIQDRRGPRVVALAGGVIYAIGIVLASMTRGSEDLWLLIAGYGVISGFGLGVAYIVPIAMLQKWFPDKKGLITGLAVGGFGFGAVLTSPVARWLIDQDEAQPSKAFLWLGIAYLVMSLAGASIFRNPPSDYVVPGHERTTATTTEPAAEEYTEKAALRTPQWYLLTAILTLNVTAGIALISQAAASAEGIADYTAAGAATVVGILAIFNGAGRIVWAAASDRIGRMPAFAAMLALQGGCLLLLPHAENQALWLALAAVVYLCYGGGFGTMPATAGDYFGVRYAGAIYGLMLIGWSLGGVIGPIVISALLGDGDPNYTLGYTTIGIIALVSVALTLITKVPRARREAVGS